MKALMTLFILFSAFAVLNVAAAKGPNYRNRLCKQKYIPMKIEQSLEGHLLSVKFTAQRTIDQFTIKNVRGIQGVKVTKFQEQNQTTIESGEVLTSAVELSDFKGLAYVVFDVSITLEGVVTGHSIPVPVGSLSAIQKAERSKNIKTIKVPSQKEQSKEGSSPLTAPAKKIHEMQVD